MYINQTDIAEDADGNIWIVGGHTMYKYDGTWTEYHPEDGLVTGIYGLFHKSQRI